jgi:predicted RNase H-like HicB family nuclease
MKEYTVIYEQGPRNWSAYVPDLPGCIATGKSFEQTEANMQKAIQMHITAMRRDGDPIPEPTTRASTVAVAA